MENCYATTNIDRYKELKQSAKDMRNRPTDAEAMLWQFLKSNQLGVKFRRQHPIDDYIADLICLSKHLVIEVDGGYHKEANTIEHDKIRDKRLLELGFQTIRFTNRQILYSLETVLEKIKNIINKG